MREATNLAWADSPFGAGRRPFAEKTPRLAAFAVIPRDGGSPAAAAAVYLRLPRPRPLLVTETTLRFGYHAVATDTPAEVPAVVAMVDRLLVQARRQAVILAGHRFADELATLSAAAGGRPGRGIAAVADRWPADSTDRPADSADRGGARLVDTAHGSASGSLPDLCADHQLTGRHPDPHQPDPVDGWTVPAGPVSSSELLGYAIDQALAIALIAASTSGHYQWTSELNLAALVEAEAWDQALAVAAGPADP